jgi:hypothetical protein
MNDYGHRFNNNSTHDDGFKIKERYKISEVITTNTPITGRKFNHAQQQPLPHQKIK